MAVAAVACAVGTPGVHWVGGRTCCAGCTLRRDRTRGVPPPPPRHPAEVGRVFHLVALLCRGPVAGPAWGGRNACSDFLVVPWRDWRTSEQRAVGWAWRGWHVVGFRACRRVQWVDVPRSLSQCFPRFVLLLRLLVFRCVAADLLWALAAPGQGT